MNSTLTALKGVQVGHATHPEANTGCTFVLFDRDLPVAYKSFGGGAGTYNTEMLNNGMSFYTRHGLFVAGGSLTGLASAHTITQKMIEKKIGFKNGAIINPSISGAIVFDLGVFTKQFDPNFGAEAFDNLNTKPIARGNVGAGTGTTVGKFMYTKDMKSLEMKAGVGCARVDLGGGVIVTAMSIVNALGNIINEDGTVLAGTRNENGGFVSFENATTVFTEQSSNTTISIVGINVDLKSRENYEKVAQMGCQGQIRAISPVNTSVDGDTVFVFSTEEISDFLSPVGKSVTESIWHNIRVDLVGHAAARAVRESIYDACKQAQTISFAGAYNGIIPSASEYHQ